MIKKYKKEYDYSYTLGTTLTFELLKYRNDLVTKIYIHPLLNKDETYDKLIALAKKYQITIEEGIKPFNILADKENCYVMGEFKKYNDELDQTNHVVLVNIADAGNLGTIMRSCLGFQITNIAIIKPAVDRFNPKVIRSSMGACFRVKVKYYDTFEEYAKNFHHHSFYPLMLQANKSLDENVVFQKPYSLIFGNEGSGLSPDFLQKGTPIVIKHSSDIDSLNLPIAVSITLYEATKDNF